MVLVTIENKKIKVNSGITLNDIINPLENNLYKDVIAAYIDNNITDLYYIINRDVNIKLIYKDDDQALDIIRHSCAHLLAHAIKLLYTDVNTVIGPTIKDGFYYDFCIKDTLKINDFNKIEEKMKQLIKENIPLEKHTVSYDNALEIFKDNIYKINIIKNIKSTESITYYKQKDFIDLCKGPHVPNTKYLSYFKLLKVSGAYWKGNSKNKMLQRVYGTAWNSKNKLNEYIIYINEIKKKDHRKIGLDLDLFHFQKESPGTIFWHNKGWDIYTNIIEYLRNILIKNNYYEVNTPIMLNSILFKRSGHIDKFNENIFKFNDIILKPMNCPCHIQIFNNKIRSYKDLPLRLFEFGLCSRNELSGSLYGLMRLKNFVQDDAHIFCTEEQIYSETVNFIILLKKIYLKFNFKKIIVQLSKRPENKIGDAALWSKAENILENILINLNMKYKISNEGAFYGPKLEFILTDNIGREWQCGTIQVDFFTSKKLKARYIDKNGKIINPIILHRAILGSIERFIGILLEETYGYFPFWLFPVQIIIISISDMNTNYINYINNIYSVLKSKFKVKLDLTSKNIQHKIKKYILEKIPYIIIIGYKEMKTNTISIKQLDGNNINNISLYVFINKILKNKE